MQKKYHRCSVINDLAIIHSDISAYRCLARYHYRQHQIGPYRKIFAVIKKGPHGGGYFGQPLGVIVYAMPPMNSQMRNIATANCYRFGSDRSARLKAVNRDFSCISRVIIDPRIRGLSIASWLVKETLKKIETKYVEAFAVMGEVNPFFERAGMKKFSAPLPLRCVQMIEAFSAVGIERKYHIDAAGAIELIKKLQPGRQAFIECQINKFLSAYKLGSAVKTDPLEKLKYVFTRMNHRPIYYIWSSKERL